MSSSLGGVSSDGLERWVLCVHRRFDGKGFGRGEDAGRTRRDGFAIGRGEVGGRSGPVRSMENQERSSDRK